MPNEEYERLTLDEWNRFAVLWQACSKINFFKKFLFFKFLNRWRRNSKFSRFIKLKKVISRRILQNVPSYADALISISKLIQEIIVIKFLPFDDEIKLVEEAPKVIQEEKSNVTPKISPNNTMSLIERVRQRKQSVMPKTKVIVYKIFSLDEFIRQVGELNLKSDEVLNYFFVYVKYILTNTREKLFHKLRFYEKLVHQTDPL